jgi:ABC-type multidrug transport system fused ATPase/permease subunit
VPDACADYDTDAAIQRSLRHELGKDVTVLVVAHRVQSVMDSDKIVSSTVELLCELISNICPDGA